MRKEEFNSPKEYIEYLIFKKDALSMKNIIAFLIVIGIISASLLQLGKTFNKDFDWFQGNTITDDSMKEALLQAGYSEEDINNMSEEELISHFNNVSSSNKQQNAGTHKYNEFPEQEAEVLKQDYYLEASKGNFEYITNDFEEKKMRYYFSETYNKDLITIYNDAYYLKTIINNNSNDSFKIKQVLSNLKDPRMLLFGTLLSQEKHRRDVIVDKFSLSPILVKKHITTTSLYSTSMASLSSQPANKKDMRFNEMAKYLNDGNYIFYKLDFIVDNNQLTAYFYKNMSNFQLNLYGMYSDDINTIYLRVYDFIQMENGSSQNSVNQNVNTVSPESNPTSNDFEENTQENFAEDTQDNSTLKEDTVINDEEDTYYPEEELNLD